MLADQRRHVGKFWKIRHAEKIMLADNEGVLILKESMLKCSSCGVSLYIKTALK
jgi:hypothetical protein